MNSFAANLNLPIPDLWEVRDVINKVKSVVLNYTEMEAKVHEATNNEAWGASSTLMQEIAQGTFNYEQFSEIMPTIYKRFTEKEAKQWRQIYKSLVLLEYLVKNGSERVVDDARSHVSMIKMMKNFHYIDDKGKDQGINVRNRAKQLAELLGDIELIKVERKKAKKNRNKYTGVGSDGGMAYQSSSMSSSRFEGFGNTSFSSSGTGMQGFGSDDLYDDVDDMGTSGKYDDDSHFPSGSYESRRRRSSANSKKSATAAAAATSSSTASTTTNKPKTAKEMNLFDFDDEPVQTTSKAGNVAKNYDDWGDFATGGVGGDDDDFDDFQSAPTTTAAPAKPAHSTITSTQAKKTNDIFDLLGEDNVNTSTTSAPPVSNLMLAQGISVDSLVTGHSPQPLNSHATPTAPAASAIQPTNTMKTPTLATQNSSNDNNKPTTSSTQSPASSSAASIGGIWSQGSKLINLDSLTSPQAPKKQEQGPTINSLKTSSINASWNSWGTSNSSSSAATPSQQSTQPPQQQQQNKQQSLFDDLLM
ncbi:hypothetical protein BDF20DRAFT_910735 [Mycotypha africana]|uniref:uncharacterized protein n=1 Tax=Mycotypha africana TaxID=64632 RepID=UPI002301361C|nr:uncharacterized protein BDF20DRAFT_910735 [Mycotypha africana]KAI8988213.1 hypothetical protein BDF20DRAFT_910735 [Mycotypha africana]